MDKSNFDPKRLVAASYDRIAERYLEWRADQHREGAAPWLSILQQHLAPSTSVLDVGCGAGIPLTRALAEKFDVTGETFRLIKSNSHAATCPSLDLSTATSLRLSFR